MDPGPSDLLFGVGFAFVFPIIVYLTGMAWNKTVGAPAKTNKIWASFCLLLPIVALGMFVQVAFENVTLLWSSRPFLVAMVGLVFGIIAPSLLIAPVVRIWRPPQNSNSPNLTKSQIR